MQKNGSTPMSDGDKLSKSELYKIALDTRNMEIGLFWQRSNYFLVLNTATAVGFFLKATEKYQMLIGLFGLIVAVLWLGVNLGSKFWQSRWEFRLREAEKSLEQNIQYFSASWETINSDVEKSLNFSNHNKLRKIIDKLVIMKPSVSFIMTLLSILFILLWLGLIIMSVWCNNA